MKKRIMMIFTVVSLGTLLVACGGKEAASSDDVIKNQEVVEETIVDDMDAEPEDEAVILESDPLPESWHGEWVCVYSEVTHHIKEGNTIFVKDFDNAVRYTYMVDEDTREMNRWFFYDATDNFINIYNEQPPFLKDGWIRESFDIKKESETEIVLTRKDNGQEVRFEKN